LVCSCAPIEIALKAQSLRVLNAADGSDGATRVPFNLEVAGFAVLALSATYLIGLYRA
jgi:hypothetical protein